MNPFETIWLGFAKLVRARERERASSLVDHFVFAEIGNDGADTAENDVTLDASGEPVKKERRLEKHCSWLYIKL